MVLYKTYIANSKIPNAGKGLFIKEPLKRGKVIIIPNDRHDLLSAQQIDAFPNDSIEYQSSIRWFEDIFTIDPDWSLESHLNHSFEPNLIWHLGFVFAKKDLYPDDELTIDYTHLLDEKTELEFMDSKTGRSIRGLSFSQKMLKSSKELIEIFDA